MYENQLQHLTDELRLLDLLLLRQLHIRQKNFVKDTGTHEFFISPEEVISLLNHSVGAVSDNTPGVESIDGRIKALQADIDRKLLESDADGFPLLRLAAVFGLDSFEMKTLLMTLAPEIDKKYENIYAYLNDDASKKSPSISIALDILSTDRMEKIKKWKYFSPDSALLSHYFIHIIDEQAGNSSFSRKVTLDERIKRFIAGDDGLSSSLSHIVQIYHPHGNDETNSALRIDIKDKIFRLIVTGKDRNIGKQVFWLYGKAREDKKAVAQSICREIGVPLLLADIEDISFEHDVRCFIKTLFREAALQSAFVFLTGGDYLYGQDEKSSYLKRTLLRVMNRISWITFISADAAWMPEVNDGNLPWHPVEFNNPGYAERKIIWTDALGGSVRISGPDIEALSGRFNLSEYRIRDTVSFAKQFDGGDELSFDGLDAACKTQSGQRLSVYSTKVTPHYNWDDIVLPENAKKQLSEIGSYIKYKHVVYCDWGFENKLALGKGINILFTGPSGTGKTMAAEIISNELKLDIYKIDLSQVVSKYIGETEKNLSVIFREAETLNAVLFFDEADALFGKRSEVRDSHDRYANIEIGHLLQKMEEHEGVVILATNFNKNMDNAFLRRMQFIVNFPFPDEEIRKGIWQNIFPPEAALDRIDYEFLADKFKLAGGNIKNIAVHAAFLAAANSGRISMEHIMQSVTREYQKMGCSLSNVTAYEQEEEIQ